MEQSSWSVLSVINVSFEDGVLVCTSIFMPGVFCWALFVVDG